MVAFPSGQRERLKIPCEMLRGFESHRYQLVPLAQLVRALVL